MYNEKNDNLYYIIMKLQRIRVWNMVYNTAIYYPFSKLGNIKASD